MADVARSVMGMGQPSAYATHCCPLSTYSSPRLVLSNLNTHVTSNSITNSKYNLIIKVLNEDTNLKST
jgi:hypothetical protein